MSRDSGLVQCEVTGNWVSEDEVITFQGKRVGAEGKAILLERLRSGADAPGTMLAPTVLARFGGLFLDGFIASFFALFVAVPIFFASFGPPGTDGPSPETLSNIFQSVFQTVMGVVIIAYFAFFHARSGQTWGKRAAHTKVVTMEGGPIDGQTAFLRALYYYLPSLLASAVTLVFVLSQLSTPEPIGEGPAPGVGGLTAVFIAISAISGIYALADMLFALFDRAQQRSIHDRLAKTRVIRV